MRALALVRFLALAPSAHATLIGNTVGGCFSDAGCSDGVSGGQDAKV